jgi:hypothetical protein
VLELRRGRAGQREFFGGWLGARLVAREEEEREEKRGRLRSGFYRVAQCGREGEREGTRPAKDRRRRRRAPSGTHGRVAASALAARRGRAGKSQQGGADGGWPSKEPRGVDVTPDL